MRYGIALGTAFSAIVVCSLIPRPAQSQVASTPSGASIRAGTLGYLGITNVRCNCTFRTDDDGNRNFVFRSNPVVLGVYRRSPADGALLRGDTITAIDGVSLLTADGGRRFANIRPGQRLTLNVSRGSARMTLLLKSASVNVADARSPAYYAPEASRGVWSDDFPAPAALLAVPSIPSTPAIPARARLVPLTPLPSIAPVPPVPESPASPAGWFGFSIRCNQCGWSLSRGDDSPVWESDTPPELAMVAAGSPAGRAGLLTGDRITHIDGISILTPRGARKFGGVRPGQVIRLTLLRGGKSLTRELTLATRPEVRAAIAVASAAPRASSARRELRYTGQLDKVSVEVWSAGGPTVERAGDTMLITVGTSVIRLKINK
ncbi:MAG: PDZ domain-containing protein [Gemmatimonadaceae bacterium]